MTFFKLLLIFHILGDFYFYPKQLKKLNDKKIIFLVIHALIYIIFFLILFFVSQDFLSISLIIAGLFIFHFLIDYFFIKIGKETKNTALFIINQIIKLLILLIIWFILKDSIIDVAVINEFLQELDLFADIEKIISVVCILLLIVKPASLFIEKVITFVDVNAEDENVDEFQVLEIKEDKENEKETHTKKNINYGSLIGILERISIVLLAVLNLWASIALVITAKSIARFKQLEDKKFAQKYLIGTLLSLVITLVVLIVFL